MSELHRNFFVLSGGPCSGKTTAVEALRAAGHRVLPEAATQLIEDPSTRDLRRDPLAFQRCVLERQLANEAEALEIAAGGRPVFLDRGVGDGFGYLRENGIPDFPEIVAAWESSSRRVRAVLFFEQNPDYEAADHRDENAEAARRIHDTLLREYVARHDSVITIPWLPIDERVLRVLEEAQRLL